MVWSRFLSKFLKANHSLIGAYLAALMFLPLFSFASEAVDFEICLEDDAMGPFVVSPEADETTPNGGAFIDLMKSINQKLPQLNIRIHRAPYKRCYQRVDRNLSQGAVAMHSASGTEALVFPKLAGSESDKAFLFNIKYCLYTDKNTSFTWTGEGFEGELERALLVPKGYAVIDLLEEYEVPYMTMSSSKIALTQLLRDKVAAVVTICGIGDATLAANGKAEEFSKKDIAAYKGYIAVSQTMLAQHSLDVNQFWNELAEQRETTYPSLIRKYLKL